MVFVMHGKASDIQMVQPWIFSKEKAKTTTKLSHQWKFEQRLYYFLLWQNKEHLNLMTAPLTRRSQPSAKGLMPLESFT